MGAQIQMYRALTRTLGGTPKTYGNIQTPFSDFETADSLGPALDDSIIVPAGDSFTCWEYGVHSSGWEIGFVELISAGSLYLAWKNDTPTSSTNNDPTGAAITWDGLTLTNNASYFFSTRETTTNANAVDHTSNNAGAPTRWTDAGEVDGYIYKVMCKNPGTDDVRVRVVFLG